ncbi:MAG TPA: glycoside hydrolase family 78 protein [Gemmatimonadaceae bacterium]|nr:glycoside hydrolase family 78 protein [Gemmatimonadaceae bacterium]
MNGRSVLLVAFAGWLVAPDANPVARATMTPVALRTEYLVDPLAIDTRVPRLSWTIDAGDARGVLQAGYEILVASSREKLAANTGDLWSSGIVQSGAMNQIEYAGTPLTSRREAVWKVRVRDQNGAVSNWSAPARWTMGLLTDSDWSASWIGDPAPSTDNVAATTLRRSFTLAAVPARAIIYATALGVYELRINGERVGDHVLAPEFTDYHTRTQYQAYDVTQLLRAGENVIGAYLGDGWYAGGIGLAQALIRKPRNIYGDHPRLFAQLEITSRDGQIQRIVTDGAWRTTRDGPIRSADLLNGERTDLRRDMPGWDRAGFDDRAWSPADVDKTVKTALVAQANEPVRITRDITPVSVSEPKPGVFVFDLGQNMVGWVRFAARGSAGTTVSLTHAEMLGDDGTVYTENLRGAEQTDAYTLRGTAVETLEPHFTYHGFRYVQVTGLAGRPRLQDLVGREITSSMRETGTFATSSPLITKLWNNVLWTQRDNMIGIPTDCPQRDERLGWMGDIQVFVGTSIFNADMGAFFTKWMRDVRDAQTPDGRFADFSPQPFQKTLAEMKRGDFMGVPGWGDAGVVVPWRLWQQYGDKRQLAENYQSSKRWIDFIRSNNPDLLWKNRRGNDYGDWLNSDTMKDSTIPPKGGEVPKPVFATMMFAYATDLVSRMARVLGNDGDARTYGALFNDIKTAFNKAYVSADGVIEGNTQAGYALALHFDLLPEAQRAAAFAHMLAGIDAYHGHMSTGFHSTYRMMLELARGNRADIAYKLVSNTSFPSWGYSIANGATTIWERWDGYVKGRGFQDKGMNSFNHYAIGAVGEWMYRTILGVNNDDAHPGYEHFVLRPIPGGGLSWAKGSYESIRGKIESSWTQTEGHFTLDVTIPANTTATVYVPAGAVDAVTESGMALRSATGVKDARVQDGAVAVEVGSGRYRFAVR